MPFTYAIADLHGRYDLLSKAVTRIVEHSKLDRPATVITLGDYVDRGLKSRQVIERVPPPFEPRRSNSRTTIITRPYAGDELQGRRVEISDL